MKKRQSKKNPWADLVDAAMKNTATKDGEVKDSHLGEDKEFDKAISVILQNGCDMENAYVVASQYAIDTGDTFAWKFLFARYEEFIERNEPPPMPLLKTLNEVFRRFRCDGDSINKAFGMAFDRRAAPGMNFVERERARTNASLVQHFYMQTRNLDAALDKAVAFRNAIAKGDSKSTIKRHYLKYRKINK